MAITVVKIVHIEESDREHWAFYNSYDDEVYGWFETEDEVRVIESRGTQVVERFCEDQAERKALNF